MLAAFYAADIDAMILTPAEYSELISSPFADDVVASPECPALIVDGPAEPHTRAPGSLPVVVIWLGEGLGASGPPHADLVVGPDDVDLVLGRIRGAPLASRTAAVLLRAMPGIDVDTGLAMESAAYSMLQAGPEFAAWRAIRGATPASDDHPTVRAERDGATLTITLDRPHRHNAISTRLRDELCEALAVAVVDDTIESVRLRGNGPSFCSGGDLDEFGSRPDPVTAHVTRLARSPARVIHSLAARTVVHLHGAAFGGGIEMAAFAHRVEAHPDARVALPEIALGLIPGAGGTVSLTRRIGRQRTMALTLSGREIDAATAMAWGLVDHIAG
jgi:hypothetical protein